MSVSFLDLSEVCVDFVANQRALLLSFFFFFFFVFFAISWAAPAVYGGSRARGRIRAVAAAYTTATAMQDPSQVCNLQHSSRHARSLTH